jgi:ATP-independent RNA helicase DbpA
MKLTFDTLALSPELIQMTKDLGFQEMTEIQAKSIPLILEGRDVIGQSKTGSGKTAAYTLPLLQKISSLKIDLQRKVSLHALILCPTRELCAQVTREMRKLGRKQNGLQVLAISGGQPMLPQVRALEQGVHIVVGTPGRVLDHLSKQTLDLSKVTTLILDEADRMLDMGFEEEMRTIFKAMAKERQTILFSATFPKTIESLSSAYQKNAVRITVESTEDISSIKERYLEVEESDSAEASFESRLKGLLWALAHFSPETSILFCNFKASAADLARALKKSGVSADSLHGDLEQSERDSIMAKFRNGSIRVLVATDVAARGIDIPDLDFVANFEIPKQTEIYVHRIGRTGRAGKTGTALTLAFPKEVSKILAIEEFTNRKIEVLEPEHPLHEITWNEFKEELRQEARMETLFISGGRKNKIRPGDILGALTGDAGLLGEEIGKIEIHDFFSYVAIQKKVSRTALARLQNGRIKGRKWRVEIAR